MISQLNSTESPRAMEAVSLLKLSSAGALTGVSVGGTVTIGVGVGVGVSVGVSVGTGVAVAVAVGVGVGVSVGVLIGELTVACGVLVVPCVIVALGVIVALVVIVTVGVTVTVPVTVSCAIIELTELRCVDAEISAAKRSPERINSPTRTSSKQQLSNRPTRPVFLPLRIIISRS